jgi:hypothetical protein
MNENQAPDAAIRRDVTMTAVDWAQEPSWTAYRCCCGFCCRDLTVLANHVIRKHPEVQP